VIKVEGLSHTFGDFTAISDLSFEVGQGEIFGFIGPNGAGKTTTIRILSTLLLPTSGRVSVMGFDVTTHPEDVRNVLGYMPDAWGVYPDITVSEYLSFFAAAYEIPRRQRSNSIGAIMELTDLSALRDRLVETLSKGMRQRLCLAKTLIHDPPLLILDEPADGLDPRARILLRELLRELASMGKTIFISSHILTELTGLVTSVGILERGTLRTAGDVESVIASLGAESTTEEAGLLRRFVVRTTDQDQERVLETLTARPDLDAVKALGEQEVGFSYTGSEDAVAAIVRDLVKAEAAVLGLRQEKADLEDLFMAITRGDVQ
jgi:ABC-2 type transport system ATP-binding protein